MRKVPARRMLACAFACTCGLYLYAQSFALYAGGAAHAVNGASSSIYKYSSPVGAQFGLRCDFTARHLMLSLSVEHATKDYTVENDYPGVVILKEEGRLQYANVLVLLSPGARDSLRHQFRAVFGLMFHHPYSCTTTKTYADGSTVHRDPALIELQVGAALVLGGRYSRRLGEHWKLFAEALVRYKFIQETQDFPDHFTLDQHANVPLDHLSVAVNVGVGWILGR